MQNRMLKYQVSAIFTRVWSAILDFSFPSPPILSLECILSKHYTCQSHAEFFPFISLPCAFLFFLLPLNNLQLQSPWFVVDYSLVVGSNAQSTSGYLQ